MLNTPAALTSSHGSPRSALIRSAAALTEAASRTSAAYARSGASTIRFLEVDARDREAVGCQPTADRRADAARRPGDDGGSRQFHMTSATDLVSRIAAQNER